MGPEASIEYNNGRYAKALGIIFRKLNFGEGWPDRILLYRGHVLFIEYKAPGQKPTALQDYQIDLLRKQGFRVEVIDDAIKGRELIKDWHDKIDQHLAGIR